MIDRTNFASQLDEIRQSLMVTNSMVGSLFVNVMKSILKMNFFQNQKPFYSNFNVIFRKKEKSPKMELFDKM